MTTIRWILPAASAAFLVACVYFDRPLELEVVNESDAEAVVTIRAEDDAAGESFAVPAGDRRSVSTDRPALWSIWVNDQRATSYEVWPDDNPTIDLTIYVRRDGDVEVMDE